MEGVGVLKGFERSAFRLLPCGWLVGGLVLMNVEEEEKIILQARYLYPLVDRFVLGKRAVGKRRKKKPPPTVYNPP